jgi:hypothetical protein
MGVVLTDRSTVIMQIIAGMGLCNVDFAERVMLIIRGDVCV